MCDRRLAPLGSTRKHLGTKVQIRVRRGGKSGEVVVKFYDLDHFDGLMGRMGFVMR
ncbi:MAG: hypothetical protein IT438_10110 [Phycisphaerales bacterium]|nr:hypothetical protein [Phycisphaerales bacterium]